MTKDEALEQTLALLPPDWPTERHVEAFLRIDRDAERRGALAELRRMARERCAHCRIGAELHSGVQGGCLAQAEHRRIAELEAQS